MIIVYGSSLSPFVRKVLAFAAEKGIDLPKIIQLLTAAREAAVIQECLRSGRSFVVDNTNTTRAIRAPLIREAKTAGFQVHSYFFEVPVRTAIGRNNHRKDKKPIPVPAILRTAKYLEPPSLDEGFDQVRAVKDEAKVD